MKLLAKCNQRCHARIASDDFGANTPGTSDTADAVAASHGKSRSGSLIVTIRTARRLIHATQLTFTAMPAPSK